MMGGKKKEALWGERILSVLFLHTSFVATSICIPWFSWEENGWLENVHNAMHKKKHLKQKIH